MHDKNRKNLETGAVFFLGSGEEDRERRIAK